MTKDHETEPDDLVERLEDSKGWPNLGKAAAKRIRADAEVIKAAEELAEAADMCLPATDEPMSKDQALRLATALAAFRRAQQCPRRTRGEDR